ncbi:hypothetical protein BT96DRAFT_825105, partial [Gymnopus androsaceus JB14]
MSKSDDATPRFAKLDDENYPTWHISMEAKLIQKSYWYDIIEFTVDTHDSAGNPRNQADVDADILKKKNKRTATKMAEARAELILHVE